MRIFAAALVLLWTITAALASQNSLFSPTTGTVSGLQLSTNYNNAVDSVNTCNSGTSAPTNQLSGVPSQGNCWLNTTTMALQYYNGTGLVPVGWLSFSAQSVWVSALQVGDQTAIASASSINPCSTTASWIQVTGTTAITSLGSSCPGGTVKWFQFSGILTLTYSGSLQVPTGANITTAANDWMQCIYSGGLGDWICPFYQRATGAALSTTGISLNSNGIGSGMVDYTYGVNAALTATVASSNLTMCLVTRDASTAPSAADPVLFTTRSTNPAGGFAQLVTVTQSTCFTINNGNTLGTNSGVGFRLWIVGINNGGTPLIGAYLASTLSSCQKLNDGVPVSTGSGTNGGSSANVVYTSVSSLSGIGVKLLGYMEWGSGLATAGAWTSGPTNIQMMGPGIKMPCDRVQVAYGTATGTTSCGTSFTAVATNDTGTIGVQSTANLVRVTADVTINVIASANSYTQIYRGPGATTAVGNGAVLTAGSSNTLMPSHMEAIDRPNATGAITYTVYCLSNGGATVNTGGGTMQIQLEEIMGMLKPDNDNVWNPERNRMVG